MTKTLRVFVVFAVCLLLTACFAAISASDSRESQRAGVEHRTGDAVCLSCHQEQKQFWRTAHHLTSRLATADSIAGKFSGGENVLKTSNPELRYEMERTKDGFFQTAVLGTPPDTVSLSRRFDFVIGSGRKGQTYLYWGEGDRLNQLPASYWTDLGKWVNSPGYIDGELNFGRPIPPRCLECHGSYFESIPEPGAVNRYNKSDYVLGVSCETCHGPGKEHARRQRSQVARSSGQAIINPARLSRVRQVEACALCHGGAGVGRAPSFSYVPGMPLAEHIQLSSPHPDEPIDVHGNQVALLERSRCFQSSAMTCSTCHNVHLPQRSAAAFSVNCLTCHKVENCGIFQKRGHKIAENCVDCHMPSLTSNLIVSTNEGKKVQPQVRSHWIKVYGQ